MCTLKADKKRKKKRVQRKPTKPSLTRRIEPETRRALNCRIKRTKHSMFYTLTMQFRELFSIYDKFFYTQKLYYRVGCEILKHDNTETLVRISAIHSAELTHLHRRNFSKTFHNNCSRVLIYCVSDERNGRKHRPLSACACCLSCHDVTDALLSLRFSVTNQLK